MRLSQAIDMLDLIIHTLQQVVAQKANADHEQAISTITGLAQALADKMNADQTFSLDDLLDVAGAAEAAVNYVLVKNAEGLWVPSTALAALGIHEHFISEVQGLTQALNDLTTAINQKANSSRNISGGGLATGGGDLSQDRTITVHKATDAEHQERVRDDVAATPKGVGLALAAYNKWETISYVTLSGISLWSLAGLSEFHQLRIVADFRSAGGNAIGDMHFSNDNGATFIASAGSYHVQRDGANVNGLYSATGDVSGIPAIGGGNALTAGETAGIETTILVHRFNKALRSLGTVRSSGIHTVRFIDDLSFVCSPSTAHNAIRILFTSAVNGTIHLEGIKG